MSPRQRTSEDVILRTTIDLMARHGVSGVTVDTVAATAGVSKATIYRRWRSRAQLLHAAISSLQRPLVEPDTGSLRDDLTDLLRQLVAYLNRRDSGPVFASFVEAAARDPELAALRTASVRDGRATYERALRRGIQRGDLPDDVDLELVVDMLMAPLVYRRIVAQSPVRVADVEPIVDAVLAAFARVPT